MSSAWVVETIYVLEEGSSRLTSRGLALAPEHCSLQTLEECLNRRILIAIGACQAFRVRGRSMSFSKQDNHETAFASLITLTQ